MLSYIFRWKNNPRRKELYGRPCRVLCASGPPMRSVLVEFEDGERVVTDEYAIRKAAKSDRQEPRLF